MQCALTYRRRFFGGLLIAAFLICSTIASADALSNLAGFTGPCGNPKVLCLCNMASANGSNAAIPMMPSVEHAQAAVLTPVKLTSVSPAVAPNVNITSFAFTSSDITVAVGTTVQWTLVNGTHTTTSDSATWNSGTLTAGNTFSFTFNSPGDFPYHCSFHSFMTGVVHVQAVPEPASLALLSVLGTLLTRRRRVISE